MTTKSYSSLTSMCVTQEINQCLTRHQNNCIGVFIQILTYLFIIFNLNVLTINVFINVVSNKLNKFTLISHIDCKAKVPI